MKATLCCFHCTALPLDLLSVAETSWYLLPLLWPRKSSLALIVLDAVERARPQCARLAAAHAALACCMRVRPHAQCGARPSAPGGSCGAGVVKEWSLFCAFLPSTACGPRGRWHVVAWLAVLGVLGDGGEQTEHTCTHPHAKRRRQWPSCMRVWVGLGVLRRCRHVRHQCEPADSPGHVAADDLLSR